MKKILSLFALLMMIVVGAKADTYKATYNGSEVSDPEGFFTHDTSGKFNLNNKFNGCTWDGITYTKGLKMEGTTTVMFTTENTATVTIVQSNWSTNTIKFDGNELPIADAEAITGGYVHTITGVAAGDHTVTRGSGENGLFAITVEDEAPAPTGEPAITKQPQDATYIIGSTDYPNMEVEAVASAGDLQYQWQYMNPLTSEYANIPDQITSAKTSVLSGQEAVAFVGSFVTGPATLWMRCIVSDDNGSVESSAAALIIKNKSVATPVVTPASGTYFSESITMTATCETEGATIYYLDGNDWLELPAEGVTFTETTSTQVKAICEGYDDSDIVSVSYTKFEKSDIVPINSETEWTLTSSLTLQLSGETMPKKSDELYTYSDIASLNNITLPAGFDGTTLAFSGEYVFRENNGAQNALLQFNTEVPGNVEIEFSNTGGSNKGRYVKVNDQIGEVEADGTTHRTETFFVEKGDVSITGYNPVPEGNPALRFYSIKFTPAEAPTVTINIEGFATFSCEKHVEIAPGTAGVKVYYANDVKDGKLYLAELGDGMIPAETGVVLAGEAGTVVQFVEIDDPQLEIDNLLKPTTTANGLVPVPENPTDGSPDALTLDGKTFKTFTGATFNANKAYLVKHEIVNAMAGNTLEIVFEGEATAITDINANENADSVAPAKVIKNGQLFIGNYNVAGQQVK